MKFKYILLGVLFFVGQDAAPANLKVNTVAT